MGGRTDRTDRGDLGGAGRRARRIGWMAAGALGVLLAGLATAPAQAAATFARIDGADRYETAANVSASEFSPGASAAFLTTGENFPDALVAAPVAATAIGPVLLTRPTTLPASTAAELARVKPAKIVVLGGTEAVSQAVMDQVKQYTTGTVTRVAGATRADTAAQLSAATFPAGIDTVTVATGAGFADALSGGPAAANLPGGSGPILLTDANSLPQATVTELQRLHAKSVVVLGGPSAVSDAVVAQLDAYSVDPVVRRAGSNRYSTAVAISASTFTKADTVYLATGTNFPDAIAAGPVAALAHAPVLLAERTCVPPQVDAELNRLAPDAVIVLGGDSAVTDDVLARRVCPVA